MDSKKVKFTPEQVASIKHRGSSLLVSAAAGSGKTKVLVERLLSHVDEGADFDEFLVITYTRAAAFELRERIYEELMSRLANSPGSKRLRRQALLCRGASIDTIHTICGNLIRENSHLVKLPPDFRIADETESKLIMIAVADDVIDDIYEKLDENPGFKLLIDAVVEGRDDKKLIDLILDLHNRLSSLPYPNAWIAEQIEKQQLTGITDISETAYGAFMLKKLQLTAGYILKEINRLRDEMRQHPDFEIKYIESVEEIINQTEVLYSALKVGWDEARSKSIFEFSRAKSISGYEELKEIRNKCVKELKKCATELECSSADHIKEALSISPAITALLSLLLSFDAAYTEEKRRRGVADFSDLEHLTLSLLVDEKTGEKTDLALNLSGRFKEILIDEYQDVNAVQEMIFSALSQFNSNVFMVGDVKQSIYRFRQADPSIFLSKYQRFTEEPPENDPLPSFKEEKFSNGRKIYLSRNFRSRAGILETVNQIFNNIMSTEFGELEYTGKEWLVAGRGDALIEGFGDISAGEEDDEKNIEKGKQGKPYINLLETPPVSLELLDMSTIDTDSDEESPAAIQVEAEFVASEIEKLTKGTYFITDGDGEKRIVRKSDIVILLRSMKGRAWQFASALSERGIQTDLPGGEDFFETTEVAAALAILSVIDNPLQDIPIASLLSGPVYRFNSDELAEIRVISKEISYYEALIESAERETGSEETRCKCKRVLEDIEEMRAIVTEMTADRFIWYVYNRTGLLGLVSAMKGGEKRRKNLINLAESARYFESSGYKGLFGFLTYIRSLQERGENLPVRTGENDISAENIDAVRILSVHKSKGLEFPIVFLSNTFKQFNYMDMRKNVVFHSDLGIGSIMINKRLRIKYSTLAREAIRSKLSDEMFSEELRVLYVAMTRAKEKLIITGTLRDAGRTLAKINTLPPGKKAPQELMSLRSMAEWIIAGTESKDSKDIAVRVLPSIDYIADMSEKDDSLTQMKQPKESYTDAKIESQLKTKSPKLKKSEQNKSNEIDISDQTKREEIKPDFDFEYPYKNVIDLPSKLTVTGLGKLADLESETASWAKERSENFKYKASPIFISDKRSISGAQRGTVIHLVMQHIDYKMGSDDDLLSNQLQHMVEMGLLSDEQLSAIDKKQIIQLLNSELGSRMINAKYIKREFKFSILTPAEKYFPGGGDDPLLLQGVVDCFFEENNELIVVDFKSDKINEKTLKEKVASYKPQLDTYADALEKITGKHVKEKIIYFFSLDTAVRI